MNEESLNAFVDGIVDFEKKTFAEQIKYFVYYYQKNEAKDTVNSGDIINAYTLLDILPPKNATDVLNKLCDIKVLLKRGNEYLLQRHIRKGLDELLGKTPIVKEINDNLRLLLPKIKDIDNKEFLKEAIDCLEIKAYRSAVIMTWLLVIHNLYDFIYRNRLNDFNQELNKKNLKIKIISSKDDFNEIKESIFIEISRAANIITNDQRKILDEKLGIRNTCAHPNNIIIREAKAVNFIEDLVENIYLKFL